MKLLRLSLTAFAAFLLGIIVYRACLDLPAWTQPAVDRASRHYKPAPAGTIVLANNADAFQSIDVGDTSALDAVDFRVEPVPAMAPPTPRQRSIPPLSSQAPTDLILPDDSSLVLELADASPAATPAHDPFAPSESRPSDDFILSEDSVPMLDDPPVAVDQLHDDFVIDAVPEGSRVRVDSGDMIIEADSIALENAPTPRPDISAAPAEDDDWKPLSDSKLETAVAPENPIPEFLRGQQLPPVLAGQKVVTIQVPVDNWVDLGWGDFVQVGQEMRGSGVSDNGSGVQGMIQLDLLDRVQIYAMPQFAPERAETVPVCLVVNSEHARELLKRRGHGAFKLTVVQKNQPVYSTYPSETPTYSSVAAPQTADESELQSTYKDDATDYQAEPAESDDPLPQQPSLDPAESNPDPEFRSPVDNTIEATVAPPKAEPGTPTEVAQEPVDLVGRDHFNNRTVVELLQPRLEAADDSLPAIEPSELGTVQGVTVDSELTVAAGSPSVIEDAHGGHITRVAGFDPGIIRLTPLSRKQIRIEGLKPGKTMLTITSPEHYKTPFRVGVEVTPGDSATRVVDLLRPSATTLNAVEPEATLDATGTLLDPRTVTVPAAEPIPADLGEVLPAIEPSEVGTVYQLNEQSEYVVKAGHSLIVEAPGQFLFERVSGFDSRMIRVTPDSARRLTIEGLSEGQTAMLVDWTSEYGVPLTVKVTVVPADDPRQASRDHEEELRQFAIEQANALQEYGGEQRRLHDEVTMTLQELFPEAELQITRIRDSILLRGTVPNPDMLDEIEDVAQQYAPKVLNQLRVNDGESMHPDPDPTRFIPSDKRVVTISNLDDASLALYPGARVDITRRVVLRSVVKRDGRAETVSNTTWRVIAADVTVFSVNRETKSASFVATVEQADAIESVPEEELDVAQHADVDFPLLPKVEKGHDDSEEVAARLAAISTGDAADSSLRDDIRALHDDVRRLITLLEQRMSDSSVRESETIEPLVKEPSESGDQPQSELTPSDENTIPQAGEPSGDASIEFRERLWDEVGLRVTPLPEGHLALKGQPYHGGLLVDEIRPDSPMGAAGARAGDILVGLHNWEVVSDESLRYVLNHHAGDDGSMKVYLVREGETRYGKLTLPSWPATEKPEAAAEPNHDIQDNRTLALSVRLTR